MNKTRNAGDWFQKDAADLTKDRQFNCKFFEASASQMKELGEDLPDGYIAGWASTEAIDHVRDVVRPGAFDKSIAKKGLTGPKGIKLLIQHDPNRPAGVIKKLEQREQGLWIEAQLDLGISYVNDYYRAMKMQGGLSFSIGYRLVKDGYRFVETARQEDSFWELTEVDLSEVSCVTAPCNEEAVMTYVKSREEGDPFDTISDFEKALVAAGVVKSRNDANRVTRWVKGLQLEPATPPAEEPVSATALKSMEDLSTKLAELKAAADFTTKG